MEKNDNAKKIFNSINRFAYHDAYYILLGVIVFLAWYFESAITGFIGIIMAAIIMLVALDDILPIAANIFFAPIMLFSDNVSDYLIIWPLFIPLAIAIGVFFLGNIRHKIKLGQMFIPQLCVTFALLIGGAGVVSGADYLRALPLGIVLGVGILFIYLIANHFLKEDENRDYALIFAKILMYVGIVVALETLVAVIKNDKPFIEWDLHDINLGWGNRNNIVTLLLLTGPMTVFLAIKHRFPLPYLLAGAFQFSAVILTFTRWGTLFAVIGLVTSAIFAFIVYKNKLRLCVHALIVLILSCIVYLIFMDHFNDLIISLFKHNTDFYDRNALTNEAIELFKNNLFVGAGIGYLGTNYALESMNFYYFHSTLFQVMASMGIVGLICYGVFYLTRIKVLIQKRKNVFTLFVLSAWIGFEGFSMFDTGTFVPFPNMALIIIMTLILERSNPQFNNSYIDEYNSSTTKGKIYCFAKKYDDYVYER